jgi:mono/diheme cytochrome c family protein
MTGNGAMKGGADFRVWAVVLAAILCIAADGTWLTRVPDADRAKVNPYAGNADAAAAGEKVYLDHCAKCHGDDGTGRRNKPSIRISRVMNATDGELFWLLRNGNLKKGMPTWSSLPEPTRWQVIAFVKSMGTSSMRNNLERNNFEPSDLIQKQENGR